MKYLDGSGSITFANEKHAISVKKIWLNADNKDLNDPSKTASVTLYRRTGTPITVNVTVNITTAKTSDADSAVQTKTVAVSKGREVTLKLGQVYNQTITTSDGTIYKSDSNQYVTIPLGVISTDTTVNLTSDANKWNMTVEKINVIGSPVYDYNWNASEKVDSVELNSGNSWTKDWTNLPAADTAGNKYYYYVVEDNPGDFEVSYSANNNSGIQDGTLTVTNKSKTQVEHASFNFSKKWVDEDAEDGTGSSWAGDITVTLRGTDGNGNIIASKFTIHRSDKGAFSATKSDIDGTTGISTYAFSGAEDNGVYKFKFDSLPAGYTYTLTEDKVTDYTTTYSGNGNNISTGGTVTNTKAASSFTFSKEWYGSDNTLETDWQDDILVTLTGSNGNSDLSSTYKISKGSDGLFTAARQGDGTLPDVAAGGLEFKATSTADGHFTFKFSNLPKADEKGNAYKYSLTETKVSVDYKYPDYGTNPTSVPNRGTVKNVHVPATFSFSKVWKDAEGKDVTWPTDDLGNATVLTFTLTGTKGDAQITYTFTAKPGENITVTRKTGTTVDISGKVEGNADPYTISLAGLPSGYTYTVTENSLADYTTTYGTDGTAKNAENSGEVTNTKVNNEYTDITVEKKWIDYDGTAIDPSTRSDLPDSIQFYLYQVTSTTPFEKAPTNGGSKYFIAGDARLVAPNAAASDDNYALYKVTATDNWKTTFENLPEKAESAGTTTYYGYYVQEVSTSNYTVTYSSDGTTRIISNELPAPAGDYIDIGLQKKWLTNGTNDTPPANASATFTVHQLKSTVTGSAGTIAVKIGDNQVAVCNPGDVLNIVIYGTPYHGCNIDVNGGYWAHPGADANGNGSETYTVPDQYSGSEIKFTAEDSAYTITSITNTSGGTPTYSDYVETSYTRTIQLPVDGNWSTTIKNLVQKDADGNLYKYYITEDSHTPASYTAAYENSLGEDIDHTISTSGQNIVVTNSGKEEKGSLKLTKAVTVDGKSTTGTLADGDYTFTVAKGTDSKTVKITIENGAVKSATVDGKTVDLVEDGNVKYVELTNLPLGDYTVTEETPTNGTEISSVTVDGNSSSNGGTVTVAAGEAKKVVFTNNLTTFSFTKTWKDSTLASIDWPQTDGNYTELTFTVTKTKKSDNTTSTFTVTAKPGETDVEVTLDDGTKIKKTVTQDANTKQYTITLKGLSSDYTYKVTGESDVPGYSKEVIDNAVTNTQLAAFDFEKVWKNSAGEVQTAWPVTTNEDGTITPKTISVTLTGTAEGKDNISAQYTVTKTDTGFTVTKVDGGSEQLPESGSQVEEEGKFKFRFENLPSGYTYKITDETAIDGYEKAISEDGKTVTNTELANFEFTNTWADQFGNPISWHKDNGKDTELTFTITGKKDSAEDKTYTIKVTSSTVTFDPEVDGVTGSIKDGKVTINGLPSGYTYTVKETSETISGYDAPDYGKKDDGTANEAAENNGKITNKQTATSSLPATGGPGILGYIGGGLLLMLFALLLLYINKSHERRQRLS